MRNILLLLILLPFSFAAPLVEIASPKARTYISFLKKNFPKTSLNVVVYPKYKSPYISVNGKVLPPGKENEVKEVLKKRIEEALREKKSLKISVDALNIAKKDKGFSFSFVPCNYSSRAFKGKWVAFLTGESSVLLHQVEGKLELPSGTCGRPITFSWTTSHKPKEIIFVVALFDEKGKYFISKSNRETEVKGE